MVLEQSYVVALHPLQFCVQFVVLAGADDAELVPGVPDLCERFGDLYEPLMQPRRTDEQYNLVLRDKAESRPNRIAVVQRRVKLFFVFYGGDDRPAVLLL